MEGRTTFIIAQRLSSVRGADQICVLADGEIVEQGTHAELLARDGAYRRIHDVQTQSSGAPIDGGAHVPDVVAEIGAMPGSDA